MAEIHIIPETVRLVKMTDDEYFAEKDYISNSKLSLINPDEDGSFEKFERGIKSEYSESFALGSVVHAMLLQPDYYIISDINKPSGKLGLFAEEVYKLRSTGLPLREAIYAASNIADYYSNKLSGARLKTAIKNSLSFYLQRMKYEEDPEKQTIFVCEAIRYKYNQCMLNIKDSSSKIIETLYPQGLLNPDEFYNEFAIFCEVDYIDTETGEITRLKLKGKLDNFTINHETETITLNDLKTTGKPVSYFMGNHVKTKTVTGEEVEVWYNGSFQYYHYYRQMAMYLWILQAAAKEILGISYKPKSNMLVVETIPEFKSKIYPLNGRHIKYGLDELKNLLTLVVKWMQTKQQI